MRDLVLQNHPLALMVVDQRMPEMTGVEFLREAVQIFPAARKVLLTAYADTEAAIQAINEIVSGKKAIVPATAVELSRAFGTSAQFWLNLESAYRLDLRHCMRNGSDHAAGQDRT